MLNANKTKYIVVTPKNKHPPGTEYHLSLKGIPLCRVGNTYKECTTKFLGIQIDENLSWKNQLSSINRSISRSLFMIKQVKNILPSRCLLNLYFALVHPYLSYGILAWGHAPSSSLQKTAMLQKRAIRIVLKKSYNSHTDPLFKKSNILKLRDLHEYEVARFMHKFSTNSLPKSFHQTFKLNSEMRVMTRVTRQSNLLHIPFAKSKFVLDLPKYSFPKTWNKWSTGSEKNVPFSHFQKNVKLSLLSAYESEVECTNTHCGDCRKD